MSATHRVEGAAEGEVTGHSHGLAAVTDARLHDGTEADEQPAGRVQEDRQIQVSPSSRPTDRSWLRNRCAASCPDTARWSMAGPLWC